MGHDAAGYSAVAVDQRRRDFCAAQIYRDYVAGCHIEPTYLSHEEDVQRQTVSFRAASSLALKARTYEPGFHLAFIMSELKLDLRPHYL